MRILPYRTLENVIDGLVCTFIDIEKIKQAERQSAYFKGIVETLADPLIVLDDNLVVCTANKAFYNLLHLKPDHVEGKYLYDIDRGSLNITELQKALRGLQASGTQFEDTEIKANFYTAGNKKLLLNGRTLGSPDVSDELILITFTDITEDWFALLGSNEIINAGLNGLMRIKPTLQNIANSLREQAEAIISAKGSDATKYNVNHLKTLIYELEIHQVELEIQNEELRKSQLDLADARDRYVELYEYSPVAYLILDDKGKICKANLKAEEILSTPRSFIVGSGLVQYIDASSQDDFYFHRKSVFACFEKQVSELCLHGYGNGKKK